MRVDEPTLSIVAMRRSEVRRWGGMEVVARHAPLNASIRAKWRWPVPEGDAAWSLLLRRLLVVGFARCPGNHVVLWCVPPAEQQR